MSVISPLAPLSPPTSSTADPERVVPALVVAFSSDPVIRWLLPDTTRFLTHFPVMLRMTADLATTGGGLDLAGGDTAAAIWHAPGVEIDDEALGAVVSVSIDPVRRADAFGFIERMAECHPTEPTWYLPFIGVDPTCQGRGYGSVLLEHGLARCDRDGLPAYLEASSARNRRLYERYGFEAFDEIQVADSPPMWPMLRPAR